MAWIERLPTAASFRTTPLTATFLALFGTQLSGRIIRFLYLLVIARFLSPDQVAVYLYGMAVYLALMVFASFGQGVFLATRLGRRAGRRGRLVGHSFTLRSIATSVALSAGVGFLLLHESDSLFGQALPFFLLALVARSFGDWCREWSTALEDAAWIPRTETLFRGFEAGIGLLLLISGAGVLAICALHGGMRAIEALYALSLMAQRKGHGLKPGLEPRLLRRIARISVTLAIGIGCLTLFAQSGLVVVKLLASEATAIAGFGLAMQFLTTLLILPTVLGVALVPAIGRARRRGQVGDIAAISILVKGALLTGALIAVPTQAYAAWGLELLLGPGYRVAGDVLADLTWIAGPYAVAILSCQILNALGQHRRAVVVTLSMLVAQISAMVIAYPLLGLSGASLAVILAVLVGCALGVHFLNDLDGRQGRAWWLAPLGATAVLVLVMYAAPVADAWLAPLLLAGFALWIWRSGLLNAKELAFLVARVSLAATDRRAATTQAGTKA